MAIRHGALPEDLRQLLDITQRGQLFALQDWLKAGKRICVTEGRGKNLSLLHEATHTGFHSMVEELLRAGGWSQPELADALNLARARKRYDIADLLVSHGAQAKQLDFQSCCRELDLGAMERHLRAGTDPNRDNAFAEALCTIKARPLLRFYRQFRTEFPALDDQAALALSDAVQHNLVRWTALLAWAGADPFRPVPNDRSGSFPVDPENSTTAAREGLWRNDPAILKVLHLNPTPEQAELRYIRRALLKHDSRYIVQVVRLLLYTPGAVEVPQFLEFCRYQSLASQIAVADAHLHEELKELRKSTRNVSTSAAEAKTETVPAVVEPPHTSPPVLPPTAQAQPPPIPPAP